MSPLERFLDPSKTSLKICGVTKLEEADQLIELGVEAIGINFWPKSKRYLAPEHANWLASLDPSTLRVGVFVNEDSKLALDLVKRGLIDVIQLHGDESPADTKPYQDAGVPFIKAIGVKTIDDLQHAAEFNANAILLDACAPGVYGGTGETFDWKTAIDFKDQHPNIPIILAGGIVPDNAQLATDTVQPAALDVASGAELSPGIKDFNKVSALIAATQR